MKTLFVIFAAALTMLQIANAEETQTVITQDRPKQVIVVVEEKPKTPEETVSFEQKYSGATIRISPVEFEGNKFLATTAYENYLNGDRVYAVSRAKTICSRLGYGAPVGFKIDWSDIYDSGSVTMVTYDSEGNVLPTKQSNYFYYGTVFHPGSFSSIHCTKK